MIFKPLIIAVIAVNISTNSIAADVIRETSFEFEENSYKMSLLHSKFVKTPSNPAQNEIAKYIRSELDKPFEKDNLVGRESVTEVFLDKAIGLDANMVVLYENSKPISSGRVVHIPKIAKYYDDIKDCMTKFNLSLEDGYNIGGLVINIYGEAGEKNQSSLLGKECFNQILKNFLPNPVTNYITVGTSFTDKSKMSYIYQNVLKIQLITPETGVVHYNSPRKVLTYIHKL